jgi:hypothetical protein
MFILTSPNFRGIFRYKYLIMSHLRRGRESNPRIEVLQTSALPLGYPADANRNSRSELGAVNRPLTPE